MNRMKYAGYAIMAVAVLMIGFKVGDWWRNRKASNEIADLQTQLSQSNETITLKDGLFISQTTAYLKELDKTRSDAAALMEQVQSMKGQLLTAQELTLKWKKAYEGALDATQHPVDPCAPDSKTPVPCPTQPPAPRVEVDFAGKLGPIQATGHTLTDPPEAFLKLEQVDPLRLSIAVVQNKDKTWSTIVSSSDKNLDVKVDLSGVNPLVISPKWYERVWMDLGAAALGDPAGYVGLSWRGDRYSVGAMCYASAGSMNGCGATLGVRLLK